MRNLSPHDFTFVNLSENGQYFIEFNLETHHPTGVIMCYKERLLFVHVKSQKTTCFIFVLKSHSQGIDPNCVSSSD